MVRPSLSVCVGERENLCSLVPESHTQVNSKPLISNLLIFPRVCEENLDNLSYWSEAFISQQRNCLPVPVAGLHEHMEVPGLLNTCYYAFVMS